MDSILEILQGVSMLGLRVTALAAALLATMFVSLPTAHGMIQQESGGGSAIPKKTEILEKTEISKKIEFSATPLSTDEEPTIIQNAVHAAWLNGELRWSSKSEWECFNQIIEHESSWNPWADNGMGWEETGGIPQAHPSSKMAEAGKDYRSNVWTQIKWGLNYIDSSYGTPCNAWDAWQGRAANGSYGWY